MLYKHYIETNNTLELNAVTEEGAWVTRDLSSYGIPPSAVVEIAMANNDLAYEFEVGIRKVGSSLERKFNLHKAEAGGIEAISMCTQLDEQCCIELFSESNGTASGPDIQFKILGYWVGAEYTELFETFFAGGGDAAVWTDKSLSEYGVGSGQIAEIVGVNTNYLNKATELGVRTSGSSLDRKIDIHEAEGTGVDGVTMSVMASGNDAAIQIYAEYNTDVDFYLVGYWSSPPGDYTELTNDIGSPDGNGGSDPSTGTWYGKSLAPFNVPANSVGEFIVANGAESYENWIGIRESGTSLARALQLHEIDLPSGYGIDVCRLNSIVNAQSGVELFFEDISRSHQFNIFGYWDNFIGLESYTAAKSIALWIGGNNQYIHYIEAYTPDAWRPSQHNTWETHDFGSETGNYPYPYTSGCIAEIIACNEDIDEAVWFGAREKDSSLERRILLRDSYDGFIEHDVLTFHVNVNSSSEIEIYTSGTDINRSSFYGLGCWKGAQYVELWSEFQVATQSGWINHDLISYNVPANTVVDIVITSTDDTIPQSGGVRSVGSSLDRLVEINGTASNYEPNPGGFDVVPMAVNTSGSSSTIQVYAGNSGEMSFIVKGYWEVPPGDYVETLEAINPTAGIASWARYDLYNNYDIPIDSVVDLLLGNYRYNSSNNLGAREIDPSMSPSRSESRIYPQRLIVLRETNDGESDGFGTDFVRMHANAISGCVELFRSQYPDETKFYAIGYWKNFNLIPTSLNNQIHMITMGHSSHNILDEIDYPSGLSLYVSNVPPSNNLPLFISGIPSSTSTIDLCVFGVDTFKTNSEFSDKYPSGLLCYTTGIGITPKNNQHDLFIRGYGYTYASGDLFTTGIDSQSNSIALFLKSPEIKTQSLDLFMSASEQLTESGNLFLKVPEQYSDSLNLFVQAYEFNAQAHYIEDFQSWYADASGSWVTKDLSAYIEPPANLDLSIVAEIVVVNSGIITRQGGVRTAGSSIDRTLSIFQLDADQWKEGVNSATMHVQLSDTYTIECYAEENNDIWFILMGYWVGPSYIETSGSFAPAYRDWEAGRTNLSDYGVISGAIAEVAGGEWYSTGYNIGARAVGSSIDRNPPPNRGEYNAPDYGRSYWTMFVNTSGSNAVAEFWAQYPDWQKIFVLGYWSNPPGDYIEQYSAVDVSPTSDGVWQTLDTTAPSGSIAQFFGDNDSSTKKTLGLRASGQTLERKWTSVRQTPNALTTLHVNSNSTVDAYAEDAPYGDFDLVGYWTNLNYFARSITQSGNLFTTGRGLKSNNIDFVSNGLDIATASGTPLWIHGVELADTDLFTHGHNINTVSCDCYIFGVNIYATDIEHSIDYPSGLLLYSAGSGIIPKNNRHDLFIFGCSGIAASNDLFMKSMDFQSNSIALFSKSPEPQTQSINLYIHNPVDPGSGLIRESDAIFYLSRREHYPATGDLTELIQSKSWDVTSVIITNTSWLPIIGATTTVGDGTYPIYNDMGGGLSSHLAGYALEGSAPSEQHVCGRIQDYSFPGSGSITAAFWMSGAKTPGNQVDIGWFWRSVNTLPSGSFTSIGNADPIHTVGLRVTDSSGISIYTTVKDTPYDQEYLGSGWWGGTTHWGTPTGSDWSWNTNESGTYHTWRQFWPEQNIEHDDISFFIVRSEFIASGVDGDTPDHMKVYLSVDGSPWVYVGSGATGPPTGSLYSYPDPNNQYAENAVGVKLRAINKDAGRDNVSISVNEIALWTDSDRFTNDELLGLHSVTNNYYRPLDEYKPTISPLSTYIHRIIGNFEYTPIPPCCDYRHGEICSGLLITLEVGLGNYGEDASAYLLEEIPPSGFQIRDISPAETTYPLQGSRPPARQQIFHDPQSGVMQPYEDDWANTYGAAIRWICHHNHPEKDQRRSPRPIKTYTYKLYPLYDQDLPKIDDFSFNGSGLFFGGSTGSGVFSVTTTGDIDGTTSGLTGSTIMNGTNLYISGPPTISGTTNLYLRTRESFTSAYIGDTNRTPEITDFIYAADGSAKIESLAGIEYGPPLYTKGPLQHTETCNLVIFGPAGDELNLFIHGFDIFTTSTDYPSGMLLKIGNGHLVSSGTCNLFTIGPVPYSGDIFLHTRAGIFEPPIDLFTHGHTDYSGSCHNYIKGPEFICSSGEFTYPLDSNLFTYPSGGQSPDIYIKGPEFICSSGDFVYPGDPDNFTYPYGDSSPTLYVQASDAVDDNCPLYIGPLKYNQSWTIYLQTDNNIKTKGANLFVNGYQPASGSSGVNQVFNRCRLFLEAADADYPYTAGGTENWALFLKAQAGNIIDDATWTLFLKADFTETTTCGLYTKGHASGQSPFGIDYSGLINLVCSVNPDDPNRIGAIPYDSHNNPWSLFLKCQQGHFETMNLYISGSAPVSIATSGNLFINGLFEQETDILSLYLMGISGISNNGPSGLHLYLDASILVYNTSGNLYTHGY